MTEAIIAVCGWIVARIMYLSYTVVRIYRKERYEYEQKCE